MGKINYKKIYEKNQDEWKALTREPQKYESLLAGHYSDSNHFVYELLQNAEDEHATRVIFEYHPDKLTFYHDGDPFDENDVIGVSSMLMGTKDRNSGQTIGRFGMGFKSVFKYTHQPEIYSDNEAFRIENYLLPVRINNDWDYTTVKDELVYELNSGDKYIPFKSSKHLTKINIPFTKKNESGDIECVPGSDVLLKLESIEPEILLFLTYIKRLFWVDKISGKYAMITVDEKKKDTKLKTCRIEGTGHEKSEEIANYIKYIKTFNHSKMSEAEVSVVYRLNNRLNNINEMPGTNIWVYFPTKDATDLPFLIHGSFETAVSREKLMAPSSFNLDLLNEIGDLIRDSLKDLKDRKLITQMFIRRVIIAAFRDKTIPDLKEKITGLFHKESMLPDKNGEYKKTNELSIAVPFGIAEFFGIPMFEESFRGVKGFIAFNNEREINFAEYFLWLKNDLHLKVFSMDIWAKCLSKMKRQSVNIELEDFEKLKTFYNFLSDYRDSLYLKNLTYTRSGLYERTIKECLCEAWKFLRKAPIILNEKNNLIPAYQNDSPKIYLNSSSEYKSVIASALVNRKIAKEFVPLLTDGFRISEFNNFQYVKEKIIKKYIKIKDEIEFENPDSFEDEYLEDITQILRLLDETHNTIEVEQVLKDAYIIKIKTPDGTDEFARPGETYVDTSEEGINLAIYYADIPKREAHEFEKFKYFLLDTKFFISHGVSLKKLLQLGLITTPVKEGIRHDGGPGYEYWTALGEYCPRISIDGLEKNLEYIQNCYEDDLAKEKSAEILKLVLSISRKLRGTVRHRKINPYDQEEESFSLRLLQRYQWLYNKDEEICSITDMSKHDLNTGIYGELIKDKESYKQLGFIETQADNFEQTFEMVDSLGKKDKSILLKLLARQLGMNVTDKVEKNQLEEDNENGVFIANNWESIEFPVREVINMESLVEHVRQQFFCADPIKYKQVLRQIRISKNPKTVRAYAIGMYSNETNNIICQLCKQKTEQAEVTAIANYGIELDQLNLCLCRNCAGKYKMMRDSNKENFKVEIRRQINNSYINKGLNEYIIELNSETRLHFTQTHMVEIQTIFKMLDEYGLPTNTAEEEIAVASPLLHTEKNLNLNPRKQIQTKEDKEPVKTIKEGSLVIFKMLDTGERKKIRINSKAHPIHIIFIGKRVGDIIRLTGRRFEILSVL